MDVTTKQEDEEILDGEEGEEYPRCAFCGEPSDDFLCSNDCARGYAADADDGL